MAIHEGFILCMRFQDPYRTNDDYCRKLHSRFGITVAKSFITRYFKDRFERKGTGMKRGDIIPLDKFKNNNVS